MQILILISITPAGLRLPGVGVSLGNAPGLFLALELEPYTPCGTWNLHRSDLGLTELQHLLEHQNNKHNFVRKIKDTCIKDAFLCVPNTHLSIGKES